MNSYSGHYQWNIVLSSNDCIIKKRSIFSKNLKIVGAIFHITDNTLKSAFLVFQSFNTSLLHMQVETSRSWSYGSLIYNYKCTCAISAYYHKSWESESNSWQVVLDTTLCDKVCQWFATGLWFSPGTPVSASIINWPPRYNWNIVERSIKYHKPPPHMQIFFNNAQENVIHPHRYTRHS
jgi:hypothetical protein